MAPINSSSEMVATTKLHPLFVCIHVSRARVNPKIAGIVIKKFVEDLSKNPVCWAIFTHKISWLLSQLYALVNHSTCYKSKLFKHIVQQNCAQIISSLYFFYFLFSSLCSSIWDEIANNRCTIIFRHFVVSVHMLC